MLGEELWKAAMDLVKTQTLISEVRGVVRVCVSNEVMQIRWSADQTLTRKGVRARLHRPGSRPHYGKGS